MGIRADFFDIREWQRLKFVPASQVTQEIVRIKMALRNPTYYLISSNCEHFSRFVMEGKEYSTQVQTAGVLAVSALALFLLNDND